jgi:hypothetical protein
MPSVYWDLQLVSNVEHFLSFEYLTKHKNNLLSDYAVLRAYLLYVCICNKRTSR